MPTKKRDLKQALLDDLEQIEDNVSLYYQGRNSAYQRVAIQLRNLLLGGRRSLVARVFGPVSFHALIEPSEEDSVVARAVRPKGQVFYEVSLKPAGSLVLQPGKRGGAWLSLDFTANVIPLEQWLDQVVLAPGVSIRRLIRETVDDEVAHTQDELETVIKTTSVWVFGGGAKGRQLHAMACVSLGEYVASRLRALLE